jgi:hypothetical protein
MPRATVWILLLASSCVSEPAAAPAPAAGGAADAGPAEQDAKAAPSIEVGEAPFEGARASLDDLGRAVVDALDARDRAALLAMTVNAAEYKQRLFEKLANHPNALALGPDLAWDMHNGESQGDLQSAIDDFGGRGFVFVAIEPELRKDRGEIVIHKAPKLRVKDRDGNERVLEILGPVVEHVASGGFKVLAFKDD